MKWISVKERLPKSGSEYDDDGWVLVVYLRRPNKEPGVYMARRCKDYGDDWDTGSDSLEVERVTHWMPLPAPPAQEEKEC